MTNRLANAKSLYLRKHAENPIDWWYWCDEALAIAKATDKPIFLSIGYSSCHWCTVMEGEAFSDLAIADYINNNFLPIKVDREERPDIDSIYMQALQMMTGQGGWPLNSFLSPEDLVPFYAGTYFPVDPRYGRPGFLQVLQSLRRYYDTEKDDLRERKAVILESLLTGALLQSEGEKTAEQELFRKGWETSTGIIQPNSRGNSFPMMPYAELALRGLRFPKTQESRYNGQEICRQRGLDLALGGIYDHVGGGFHRYTVDHTWTVPHFEKMLYDNGQIVEYLANLWSAGIEVPAFAESVAGTVAWLKREMTAPQGYFYAAQDADSFLSPTAGEPEEGAFYVWSYDELQALLSQTELKELEREFTVTAGGNFEGKNVLQRRNFDELSSTVKNSLDKLFMARYGDSRINITTFPPAQDNQEAKYSDWQGRIPAVTDTKMIVAWNSLMISGLARAYNVFRQPVSLELALGAANFILENQFVHKRLHRLNYQGEATVLAQSEDYAFLIKALLDIYSCCPDQKKWLETAIALQDEFDTYLWSVELGGYYNTAQDASQDLIIRERSYQDNATPSANGVAIANLVRLSLHTDNLEYLDLAEKALKAFRSVLERAPQACPSIFTALDWYRNSTQIRTTTEKIPELNCQYLPSVVLTPVSDLPSDSIALVCQGMKCLPGATSWEMLLQQVQQSQVRG
ncbi:thioredoxin domain-containing protein [Calothrix sp. 336/3]|uniref:thioredoxin domain-containing protein n=1 Tax=Calothrix sp. 336/3 TaxID=1337936 RepID=UPI0004E42E90|nr:thioredoxin domain-containing protein [Calothrix sp. 336/3]AKG22763.1 glycosidase [Calothrix sp. 336/3]